MLFFYFSVSNLPSFSLWEPTLPLYSEEGQVQVGLALRSMVFMRRVQEGATAAWIDLGFVV
jgi:hypothetical protein